MAGAKPPFKTRRSSRVAHLCLLQSAKWLRRKFSGQTPPACAAAQNLQNASQLCAARHLADDTGRFGNKEQMFSHRTFHPRIASSTFPRCFCPLHRAFRPNKTYLLKALHSALKQLLATHSSHPVNLAPSATTLCAYRQRDLSGERQFRASSRAISISLCNLALYRSKISCLYRTNCRALFAEQIPYGTG